MEVCLKMTIFPLKQAQRSRGPIRAAPPHRTIKNFVLPGYANPMIGKSIFSLSAIEKTSYDHFGRLAVILAFRALEERLAGVRFVKKIFFSFSI